MRNVTEIAADFINIEECAVCPRRSIAGRLTAYALLGYDHAADDCNPDEIVEDGQLKNYLFKEGVVARPYGLLEIPVEGLENNHGLYVGRPMFPVSRTTTTSTSIGLSDRICPRDVPEEYEGNFQQFIARITNTP